MHNRANCYVIRKISFVKLGRPELAVDTYQFKVTRFNSFFRHHSFKIFRKLQADET